MISPEKLSEKYNIPVPRYTSYPPANYFTTDYTGENYRKSLLQSNYLEPSNISLYVHIPFCNSRCWYCGCNSCPMPGKETIRAYFDALSDEIAMVVSLLDTQRKVTQIHFGGGTPNSVPVKYIRELNDFFFSKLRFIEEPEIAIECHPAYLSREYIVSLKESGFNRFSLGIQDFNEDVLTSVRREGPSIPLNEMMECLREGNPSVGINLDFIYGLPRQTPESFAETIQMAIQYNPDRLTLFPYAHVPWINRLQENLEKQGLPQPKVRSEMIEIAWQILTKKGYLKIAMDHFADPSDELADAANNSELHRNFQGYCTRRNTGQVYAFGASGISQLGQSYAQNAKDVNAYIQAIREDRFATERGYDLAPEELIIRSVINDIMCNRIIDWEKIAVKHDLDAEKLKSLTGFDADRLKMFEEDGLIIITSEKIKITELGESFLRLIASAFDPKYKPIQGTFSKPF